MRRESSLARDGVRGLVRGLLWLGLCSALFSAETAFAEGGRLGSSDEGVAAGALNPTAPIYSGPPPQAPTLPTLPLAPPVIPGPMPIDAALTPAEELPPPQPIYRRRYNLAIFGAGLLVSTWAADRLVARDLNDSTWSWIPLIGPWYILNSQLQLPAPSQLVIAGLVLDGILQAGGVAVGILGFVLRKKHFVVVLPPPAQ